MATGGTCEGTCRGAGWLSSELERLPPRGETSTPSSLLGSRKLSFIGFTTPLPLLPPLPLPLLSPAGVGREDANAGTSVCLLPLALQLPALPQGVVADATGPMLLLLPVWCRLLLLPGPLALPRGLNTAPPEGRAAVEGVPCLCVFEPAA